MFFAVTAVFLQNKNYIYVLSIYYQRFLLQLDQKIFAP